MTKDDLLDIANKYREAAEDQAAYAQAASTDASRSYYLDMMAHYLRQEKAHRLQAQEMDV